jgi:hypothetical protein
MEAEIEPVKKPASNDAAHRYQDTVAGKLLSRLDSFITWMRDLIRSHKIGWALVLLPWLQPD